MFDYIGFTFKDFDSACVVIVDELPKSYSEENRPVRCLKYLKTRKYLTFNTQHTGQSGTSGEVVFPFESWPVLPLA